MKFIVGQKLEMTQVFKEDGTVVPVTLVRVEPNVVTQIRSAEQDGYVAVQVGTDIRRALQRPQAGHVAGLEAFGVLREFRTDNTDRKRGDTIDATVFVPGDKVDVIGVSKGRGFAGVVKRHHFHGSPASHGHKDQLRMPGSIGSRRQGPVQKGKRMAGHMGDARVTVKNLEVVSVDAERKILAIRGAVPGARGSWLMIHTREGSTIWQP
jgi:large subunit ribosomal protein L3